jgi:hypothetical protein
VCTPDTKVEVEVDGDIYPSLPITTSPLDKDPAKALAELQFWLGPPEVNDKVMDWLADEKTGGVLFSDDDVRVLNLYDLKDYEDIFEDQPPMPAGYRWVIKH